MRLNHLHLHVASVDRAAEYYGRHFGLTRHVWHDDILFLRDEAGMDLALAPGPPDDFPPWSHFGFRLETPDEVRALHDRMAAEGATIRTPLTDDGDMLWFRCADPDGHQIEVYWEVQA
ncbi:MAG TPA: VOC family protein [Caulobacteraceae bacterium]|jgi:catechol 2,3-dioxygenase-like lactoylglutathione lyase family enzyme|nr:VOC family protein [Caulobacteraceae bacterium]